MKFRNILFIVILGETLCRTEIDEVKLLNTNLDFVFNSAAQEGKAYVNSLFVLDFSSLLGGREVKVR